MNHLMNFISHLSCPFKGIFNKVPLAAKLLIMLFLALSAPVFADELGLDSFFTGVNAQSGSESSLPRLSRPTSQIAENVTVINADQIARLNAHTLTDILNTVTGVQYDSFRTPATSNMMINVAGMSTENILLIIDGVPQNSPSNNWADTSWIPSGIIERVEVIKGAASAAWGPALGGVINVTTKSAAYDIKIGGKISTSYGERGTSDLNGEVSGNSGRLGYYAYGSNFHSKGLLPGNGSNANHLFSKISYTLPANGLLTLSGTLRETNTGIEENALLDYQDTDRSRLYSFDINLNQPLTQNLSLSLLSSFGHLSEQAIWGQITYTPPYRDVTERTNRNYSKGEVSWLKSGLNLVAGADYRHFNLKNNNSWSGTPDPDYRRKLDATGVYLNAAAEMGRLTILPGIRYDHTITDRDAVRYNLGATYKLSDKTILRVYGADGYGLTDLVNAGNGLQKTWTAQTGIESSDIPYLWLKAALFYSRSSNVQLYDFTTGNYLQQKLVRQGYELEVKTTQFYGFSTSAGYTYIDSYIPGNPSSSQFDAPTNSLKLSLNYDNKESGTTASLLGNYVWWNVFYDPALYAAGPSYYKPIIWDLHLNQKLFPSHGLSPELFFFGHNLFNGSQYNNSLYKNTSRWVEGGVRFRF